MLQLQMLPSQYGVLWSGCSWLAQVEAIGHILHPPLPTLPHLLSICVVQLVDRSFAGHEVFVAHFALLGQHSMERLFAVRQARIREPPRVADEVIHIWKQQHWLMC